MRGIDGEVDIYRVDAVLTGGVQCQAGMGYVIDETREDRAPPLGDEETHCLMSGAKAKVAGNSIRCRCRYNESDQVGLTSV